MAGGRRRRRATQSSSQHASPKPNEVSMSISLPNMNESLSLKSTGGPDEGLKTAMKMLGIVESWIARLVHRLSTNTTITAATTSSTNNSPTKNHNNDQLLPRQTRNGRPSFQTSAMLPVATTQKENSLLRSTSSSSSAPILPELSFRSMAPLHTTASFCTSDGIPDDGGAMLLGPLDLAVLGKLSRDEKEHLADRTREDTVALIKAAQEAITRCSSSATSVPLRFRVLLSALPPTLKIRIASRLEKMGDAGSGDNLKYVSWVETLLAVPLSRTILPTTDPSQTGAKLLKAKEYLDSVVFGHRSAKQAILERLHAWLSTPQSPQRPLALWGPPGNGKTTLARKGLATVMGRPFSFIGLGGGADASYLLGHGYTYEGSQSGRIVECLTQAGAMNPVLYFDELDKLSGTPRGDEVANVLVHLTDTTQNDIFRDRYLHGLDLNMRGALLVFSFNDKNAIPPVLLDRLDIVETEPFSREGQRAVLKDYVLPEILADAGASSDCFHLDSGAIEALLERVDASTGVRGAKAIMQQLLAKALIMRDTKGEEDLLYPLKAGAFRVQDNEIWATKEAVDMVCAANAARNINRPPMCMYS